MTVLQAAERALAPGSSPAAQGASAVFLHAGWRSCGTWLWATLRDSDTVRAFYEPLHEDLSRLDSAAIGAFCPASWGSGHGAGAPYFTEFAPRLARNGRGVTGYNPRFAFDNYFAGAAMQDSALEAYLNGLLTAAWQEGRLPVLKFSRSQGRVAWMERHFPSAFHAVVLRDPRAQWSSARAQLERDANRYFVVAPFVILLRNKSDPLLAAALDHLRVKLPPDLGGPLSVSRDVCWHHVKHLGWADRYRGFLALWAASSVTALAGNAVPIDADALADPAHRVAVEDAMRTATGLPLSLKPRRMVAPAAPWFAGGAEASDAAAAAAAALDFVNTASALLAPDRAALLTTKLALAAEGAAPNDRRHAAVQASRAAHAEALAYLAAARALYPLRRAHFHLDRWLRHA